MESKKSKLRILCFMFSAISTVLSATMKASFTPNPALKGGNSQHTVQCNFSVETGEQIMNVQLLSKSSDQVIANLYAGATKPVWNTGNVATSLKARGDVYGSFGSQYMSLTFNDTRCSDEGATYMCRMAYQVAGSGPVKESETSVQIQAGPLAPNPMSVTSASSETENVTEHTEMTFRCSGNVGMPAGSFSWFTVLGETGGRLSLTEQAVQEDSVPSGDGCTFTESSSLTLNVTRTEEEEPLRVLCLVRQQTLGDPAVRDCSDPSVDFCRRSSPINVQYPVSVSVNVAPMEVLEGTDASIICLTMGNPRPYLIEWRRENENETLATGATLTLRNVTQNDTGNLVCTAYNIITGVTHQASDSILVTVVKTTTPPPTTTPSATSTHGVTKDPGTESSKAGLGDDEVIIIVVVLVGVVVIVGVIVAIVIIRRRRVQKQFEDSSEKSINNQSEVNSMPMQPEPSGNNDQVQKNTSGFTNDDGLTYADLQFDNKPRSRRPLAIDDSHTEYADISMPQV